MAFDPELAERQLIEIYRRAPIRILETILAKKAEGSAAEFERELLADVIGIIAELDQVSKEWARQVVPKLYTLSLEETAAALRRAGVISGPVERSPLAGSFARVHREAIRAVAANFVDEMDDAHRFVARRVRDAWRQAQLEALVERFTTGQTLRQAQKNLARIIGEQGLGAFRDSAGRTWRLESYVEMAARTTSTEATNLGLTNQLQSMNRDLVQMTTHVDTCEVCAALQGRVYSISGNDPRYPPLSRAVGDYHTVHPNCRHRFVPYVEELADDPAADRAFSNRPFDVDPRTEEERRRYEAQQAERRRLREDRKQWEAYRAWLPDDAPKTLAGFRRMKAADSERYRELQRAYREVRAAAREGEASRG